MHVSVTALGAKTDRVGAAARDVVNYLQGDQANDLTRPGSRGQPEPDATRAAGPGQYYSDSAERPGRWRGNGTDTLADPVDGDALRRVLLGQHPTTGEQLISARGSSGRSTNRAKQRDLDPTERLTLDEAADIIGVDTSYLRRLARTGAPNRHEADPPTGHSRPPTGGPQPPTTALPPPTDPPTAVHRPGTAWLDADKSAGRWMVTGAEVQRFIAARNQAQVVMGYDITFSAPKSLSIVWAVADPATRRLCEEAFEAGVARGVAYLEANAISVGRGPNRQPGTGMIAASYRHSTSRELEPQLHEHVVIANMAKGADGTVKTLDARSLFAHATTAGHIAEAEMQHHTNRLGIAWTPTHRGIANIAGVPTDAIRAMSTRREQLLTLASELGTTSARGRQAAALATRAGKTTAVDPTDLRRQWVDQLASVGFGPDQLIAATTAAPVRPWSIEDSRRLDAHLAGPDGVTEHHAIFDRRDVICAIVDHAGGRLDGDAIEAHADRWLHTAAVIPLDTAHSATSALPGPHTTDATWYSTPAMVALEHAIADAYDNGWNQGTGRVPTAIIDQAIDAWEAASGRTLGDDQRAMVTSITTSGHRFQPVIGPAGSGKTAALEVAARAWEHAGFTVIGAAVNGTAAEVLERSTGIASRTVAGLVTRLDTATTPVLDPNTIVIIDEASTLGNRHHARLVHHVQTAGATMRTIGDPHQHSAVEAGGMWAHLAHAHPDRTPRLHTNRRQAGPEMTDVRLANADYRTGAIAEAIARLDANQRIITAATSGELLDHLATDWYLDHQHHRTQPGTAPSRMIAEHHHERRALNARAQALLRADGTLTGDGVRIGEADFHVGDHVIARAPNRALHPDGDPRNYLRNGTTGTVTAIEGPAGHEHLTVNFTNRGAINIPHDWLTAEIRAGITGGLAPAYAVTSHAAQGDTYRAGRMLATDTSNREAIYVGLTRGTDDTRLYTVKREPPTVDTDPQLPRITDSRTPTEALADQLTKTRPTDLATIADPDLAHVLPLTRLPLRQLETSDDPLAQRAATIVTQRIEHHAIHTPGSEVLDRIGPRPDDSDEQRAWDRAAQRLELYEARWGTHPDPSQAPRNDPHQRHDHAEVTTAVRDVLAAPLKDRPTAELAAERRSLLAELPTTDLDLSLLTTDAIDAETNLAEAQAALTAAQRHRQAVVGGGTALPNQAEAARRSVETAQAAVAVTATRASDAAAALDSAHRHVGAEQDRRDRIALIDHVLEPRISDAVAHPADYLIETLGERPSERAERWNQAADRIERYRHSHLGIDPANGPIGNSAIGAQPVEPQAAHAWRNAIDALTRSSTGPLPQGREVRQR